MKPLQGLQSLQGLQALQLQSKKPTVRKEIPLSEIELILYSTNLCYHTMNVIEGITIVQNKEAKLNTIYKELSKLDALLSHDDYFQHSTYTKQNTAKFFKEVGIRPQHLKY
jgi:hypothetical protein